MCEYFVPSKLATSNKLVPYSKWFIHEKREEAKKEEKQQSLASPTEFQTSDIYIYIYIMLVYYKCLLNWSLVDYVPSHVYNKYTFYSFIMHIQKSSTNCSITYNIYKKKKKKKRKNWITIDILTTMDLPNKHPMQNSSHTHITHTHMLKSTQDWLSQSPHINS